MPTSNQEQQHDNDNDDYALCSLMKDIVIGIVPASALVSIHLDFDDVFLKFKLHNFYFSSTIRPRHNLPVSRGVY
jgi:hypothetical protein